MAGWFCLSCMKEHFSVTEIEECRAMRAIKMRPKTPIEIREMLDYMKSHSIVIADEID